jgi:hypothetical protein
MTGEQEEGRDLDVQRKRQPVVPIGDEREPPFGLARASSMTVS